MYTGFDPCSVSDGARRGKEDEESGRQNGGSDRDEMDRTLADQYAGGHL